MSGPAGRGVLRVGDHVRFDGAIHTVVGLAGTHTRLISEAGEASVVLLAHLLGASDFELVGAEPPQALPPFALLDGLPARAIEQARRWERHVVEVETGLPPDAPPGTEPRPEYDPRFRTLAERQAAKGAELTAAGQPTSAVTIQRLRLRYRAQGVWGLVDQRTTRQPKPLGRADPRLVAAIRAQLESETDQSTGTRDRLRRRVEHRLAAEHGPGIVPLPSKATFNRLVANLSEGLHTFGSATTRRSTANRPERPFTPTIAARPGESVQLDSTPLDVMVALDYGVTGRVELTAGIDVATRTLCAPVLRPVATKAVDAALLLARMLVPEPMRPGWPEALAMAHSRIPYERLVSLDARMEHSAARPVIVPDTIVIDHHKVFVSETFLSACRTLGISVQPAHRRTPTDKAIVERTFRSINTLFCQYVRGYTGSNVAMRGAKVEAQAVWTVGELQDLLDEWIVAGWQSRPHDKLRDPQMPGRALSPNEMFAILVERAGYVPLTLTDEDYLELLPTQWRSINDYGVRIDYRTYDTPALDPYRRQPSGVKAKRDLWEVHYDPYDVSHVWVRNHHAGGWITAPWTHLPMFRQPFADFTWRRARQLAADPQDETAITRALADLLQRAGAGPDRVQRIAARTRVAAATTLLPQSEPEPAPKGNTIVRDDAHAEGQVASLGVFDPLGEGD